MYNLILKDFNLQDSQIISIYPYGSRIYGTNRKDSDHDFIVIMKSLTIDSDRLDSKNNPISITIYLEESFRKHILDHKIFALECLFCPKDKVLKETLIFDFKLNKSKLRESVSEKCSKDWNQAKKRFSDSQEVNPITGEKYLRKVYEGKKSLFHCFRMIDFAFQIIENDKIINFSSCNDLWEEIYTDPSEEWDHYKDKYYKSFNDKLIKFRKLAPK